MTDPSDALRDARARVKQFAGRMLARREAAEQQLAKLVAEQERLLADIATMQSAGRSDLEAQLTELLTQFNEQIATKREEVALADRDLKQTQAEMKELERAEKDVDRAELRSVVDRATSSDPVLQTAEEKALENVRGHAAQLEAEASLGSLSPSHASSAKLEQEVAEAKARQQLAELKARRGKAPEPAEGENKDEGDGTNTPPKRTL